MYINHYHRYKTTHLKMCSEAQIFILTGASVRAREPATDDSVTGVSEEGGTEGEKL